jgi:hypothetical protein
MQQDNQANGVTQIEWREPQKTTAPGRCLGRVQRLAPVARLGRDAVQDPSIMRNAEAWLKNIALRTNWNKLNPGPQPPYQHEDYSLHYVMSARFVRRHARTALLSLALCMKVMPHWHPDSARTVLVLSGTFYFAVGEQWDESQLKAYPAGTLYSEPARTPHYAWARDGEVILQVTAIGPTGNTPIPQKNK